MVVKYGIGKFSLSWKCSNILVFRFLGFLSLTHIHFHDAWKILVFLVAFLEYTLKLGREIRPFCSDAQTGYPYDRKEGESSSEEVQKRRGLMVETSFM